jgi:hypothetical protein
VLGTVTVVLTTIQQKQVAVTLWYVVCVDGCNTEPVADIAVTKFTFHIQADCLTSAVVQLVYKVAIEALVHLLTVPRQTIQVLLDYTHSMFQDKVEQLT